MTITTYRPQGTPGIYRGHATETTFDVVLDRDGLLWHNQQISGEWQWVRMPGWSTDRFEADDVPEWVIDCPHDRVCGTETACIALKREDGAA